MRLALARSTLRERVVKAISMAIRDGSEMSNFSLSLLVDNFGALRAKESKDVVGEVCLRGEIDERVSGGYITFLM